MNSMLRDRANPLTRTANLVLWCLVVVTLGFWRNGDDPVNIPKLLLIAAFAGPILGNIFVGKSFQSNKILALLVVFFTLSLFVPLLFSGAPLVQQFYGISGRNTGLLAYLFLAIIFLGAATFPKESDYQAIPRALLIAGYGSGAVCVLELLGINLMGANNIFGAIIGTLGNPNFISAFSGMVSVGSFALALKVNASSSQKFVWYLLTVLSFFLVIKSKSFQGLGATLLGIYLIIMLFFYFKKLWVIFFPLTLFGISGVAFFILGLLDKGPLSSAVYQYSLPIRFQYWQAGLRMFSSHLLTGVGLNSYGDWYRTTRDADAIVTPGANVTTNVAHNVYIDFASNGGIFLLVSFSLLIGLTFFYSIKALVKMKHYDSLFISTFMVWLVYLAQAFFSIDQLGLAIWGWAIGGALLGLSKVRLLEQQNLLSGENKTTSSSKGRTIAKNETNALVPQLLLFWIFVLAVFPAFKADLDWAAARRSSQAELIAKQMNAWPQDEIRFDKGIYAFLTNNLASEAVPLTEDGLKIFPRSSTMWTYLYQNPYSTVAQKNQAREKLRMLDPLNPAVLELKKQ